MAETRPTGEQLRFVSERTGEHNLDLYLEHAEKGGRVLGDLLDDLFKENGDFKADMFEFRVDPATLILQSRVGVFADNTSGWVNSNQRLFRHRGEHATATAYERLDTATFNDELYVCQVAHTSTSATPSASFARAFGYRAQVDAMIAAVQPTLDAKVAAAQTAATNANNFAISAGELRDQTLGYRNDAQTAATNASNAAAAAAQAAASTSATSTTPLTIGMGLMTLDVGLGKVFGDIQFVTITDSAAPTVNWMHGIVTGYSGGNLTVNVTSISGSGTKSAWNVSIGSVPGPPGPAYLGGTLTSAMNAAPPVTIASASTVAIGAAAANDITTSGTATITAFDAIAAGAERRVTFSGALTLTHNGTSLILPGAANITTAAGDVATFLSLGSGNWRCVDYQRASGLPVVAAPSFGGVIGDIFQTYATPQNSLKANGSRYLRSTYQTLASLLGTIFDIRSVQNDTGTFTSFYNSYVYDMVCNSLYSYEISAPSNTGASTGFYWAKYQTSTRASEGSVGNTADGRYVTMAAVSDTHLVLLMRGASGATSNYFISYAALDANGNPGTFTEWTPSGLTSHCNGFGVVNGVFWLSYNVGGSTTSPRVAWGSNPAAMTVSTPTGTSPQVDYTYSAYMFWDGANYVFWSGAQWFSGSSMGSLVRNVSPVFNGMTYMSPYTADPYLVKPSYSRDGRRMVHRTGSQFVYTDDGGYTVSYKTVPSSFTLYGAVIAGGEVFLYGYGVINGSNNYYVTQYNLLTGQLSADAYNASSSIGSAGSTNLRPTNLGVFIQGNSNLNMNRAHLILTTYDTKTTFATPNLGDTTWIRAL